MADRLEIYNEALGHLGPTRLTSLVENRPDRHELDAAYEKAIDTVLESGLWYFALRTQHWTPDEDVEPVFGLRYAYAIPSDYVRLRKISPDEQQIEEDRTFKREGNFIRSAYSELYVTFVSDDEEFGYDLGKWPTAFASAVAVQLAYKSGLPITKDRGTKNDLLILSRRQMIEAKRLNAVDEAVQTKPNSSWVTSRLARTSISQRRQSSE